MMDQPPIPARFNLARHCLAAQSAHSPEKVALIVVADPKAPAEQAEHWAYAGLDIAVRRAATGLLNSGIASGDRLMLRLPNNSDYALLFFGAIAAGIVPIPVSTQLTDDEIAFLLEDSDARAIAVSNQVGPSPSVKGAVSILDDAAIRAIKSADPVPDYADTGANDPAYMIYTSGTSSRPKGVVHAQRTVLGRVPMHRDWQGLGPDDLMLHAGSFNWSYTLGVGMIDPWANGATAVLYCGGRDIMVWPKLIEAVRPTLFAAVPSLYRQILRYCDLQPGALASLRHCLAAGESLSPALLEEWRSVAGLEIYEAFGMSECSTFVSNRPQMLVKPGSPGKAQIGRRIAVIATEGSPEPIRSGETGLLAIHRSDPGLMLGYWRRPGEEEKAYRGEWFTGGDLASFDEDGYLWHHGRADDIINPGGFRISPLEVEAGLARCPGVAEIAVGEHRVRRDVSVVAAFVVRQPGSSVDADAILAHAEKTLAVYKRPRAVFFVDQLPRSPNGKLLRRLLAPAA